MSGRPVRFLDGGRAVHRKFLGQFHFRSREGGDPDEIGYWLKRSAWGKGYATEGSRALIRKGFTELGVRRVFAETMVVHAASRRVMENPGLLYVRTFLSAVAVPYRRFGIRRRRVRTAESRL